MHPEDGFAGMEVRGDTLTDKENAGAALLDACKEVKGADPVPVGSYRGFTMSVSFDAFRQEYMLLLKGQMTHRATLGTDPRGNLTRIDNALSQMPQRLEAVKNQLDNLYQQQAAAKAEVEKLPKVSGGGREADKVYVAQDVDRALKAAESAAQAMKDEYISVEHILLGLLDSANSALKELFRTYNVTKEKVMQALASVRGNQRVTSDNPEETYNALKKYGSDLVERAREIHTLLPMATAALGRTLLAASMMGDMLKEDNGALTLQIKGGGPLGTILAVSDCGGNVRGYVQDPHVELMEKVPGKLDVGAAVGTDGSLTVIKDLGLKEPYIGSIGLFSGEIADDIAMYFVESEQIPTACALGVLVDRDQSVLAAGGYLIQLLPGAEEGLIDKIEAGVRRVGSVSHALSRGLDAQGLLEEVLSDFQLEVLETHPVEYRCSCSRERVSRALISMGREELSSLITEQGQADLSCQFCDKVYHFSKEELEGLLSSM